MMRSLRFGFCLALALGFAAGSSPALAQPQALQSVAELLKDGTIQGSTVPRGSESVAWGRAVGIVEAPIEQVMAVVQSYADYQSFMPHFKTSKVLSQRGSSALVYMQASIAKDTMTLWAQLKIGPGANVGETRVVRAKMMSGNMDAMEAVWEVTPVDGERTLVAFQLVMDPKLPLPSSFITTQNQKAATKTIRALRAVVAERAKASARR